MKELVNYEAVLADLRVNRALIDDAIRAIEALVGVQERTQCESFVGMSVLDAAKAVLTIKGESQRTTQILAALQRGGLALSGKSPINSVGAVLNRNLKEGGEIVRLRRGVWALAAWPSRPRQAIEALNGAGAGTSKTLPAHTNGDAREHEGHRLVPVQHTEGVGASLRRSAV